MNSSPEIVGMAPQYDAGPVEGKWYAAWEDAGLFQPTGEGEPYVITIPPPNITGSLHMGHALCYSLQDALGRYHRARGRRVLVLPGQDHAGIAMQSVVDKNLRKEGTSAAQLGREKFMEKAWEWREYSGGEILKGLRRFGCAFDWSRERFTLDKGYHDAVLKIFIDWFERGLIVRGKRVVNWDPKLKTSVSDIETLRVPSKGKLYHVRYVLTDGSGEIVVATTRPETIFADVAVAVHPSDERYKAMVGKTVTAPLTGWAIPVIADAYVDPEFGTGALKITPSHDANDYQVGVRHKLPMPVAFDLSGRIDLSEFRSRLSPERVAELEKYEGVDRKEARALVAEDLAAKGLLIKADDHDVALVVSDRSGEVIEPLLSEQWFCDQPALAPRVIEAVERGEVNFYPERYREIFLDWMRNIREWCISRQLWWGHRVPVYYTESGTPFAALSWEDAQAKAGDEKIVRQDDDVLDTWFSSGLWPFATLGWPDRTEDLEAFYPTSVLVTDRNIINLWVARMLMTGFDAMNAKPFSDVMIYATVLTEDGRRMSKSLGTGVDPLEVMDRVGADALRWFLASQTGENQDLRYRPAAVVESRNWANKIWNSARYILSMPRDSETVEAQTSIDKWLLSRLAKTEAEVRAAYNGYRFMDACAALREFWWGDVCDRYIEVSKSRLQAGDSGPAAILRHALRAFLVMVAPIMPHLAEEVFHHLDSSSGFLAGQPWPSDLSVSVAPEWADDEARVEQAFEVVRAARALRAELSLTPGRAAPRLAYVGDLAGLEDLVRSQAWFEELTPGKPEESSVAATAAGVDLYLPVVGLVDPEKERARLGKEAEKLRAELVKMRQRLENPQFVERAKPEALDKARADTADLESRLAKTQERLAMFGG